MVLSEAWVLIMGPIVIKARALRSPERLVITKETHLSQRRAEQIVGDAQREAGQIAEAAQRERASVMEAARLEGYAAGLAQWNGILVKAWKSHDELVSRGEGELVRLSIRIAQKIIGEELRTNADTILGIVREALRPIRRARSVVIQVSPDDELCAREKAVAFRALFGDVAEVSVVADPAVAPGGCIVESDIGVIDAQLQTQLKSLEQALLGGERS